MSQTIEATTARTIDDNDRLNEHEQPLEFYRNQLDSRLSTPDLSDEQRNRIIEEAARRVKRLETYEEDIETYRQNLEELLSDPGMSDEQKNTILEQAVNNTDISLNGAYGETDTTTRWLLEVVDPAAEYDGRIAPHHQQALKYYSGMLFELIRSEEAKGDSEVAMKVTGNIYTAYFSSSPNITTYTGGVLGQLELLSYAERSPRALSITHNLSGEVIYNGAFSGDNSIFDQAIAVKEPIPQLEILNTASRLAVQANYQGPWADPFSQKVLKELSAIGDLDSSVSPFIRIAASAKAAAVRGDLNQEWRDLSEFSTEEQQLLIEKDRLWREQDALRQQLLREEFPAAGEGHLRLVSNDAVAEVGSGSIDILTTRDGKQARLTDIDQQNDLDLSDQDAILLKAVHDTSIRQAIEAEIGIDLSHLSLDMQRHLLTFMIEAEPERYVRLIQTLDGAGEQRVELAEVFLATEFGDDYGDAILSVAEHASPEQSADIFETINKYREHSKKFAGWFEDLDPQFAGATERAMNERLTDALYATEELARTGTLSVDVAPHRNNPDYENDGRFMSEVGSLNEGIEILKGIEQTLDLQTEILTAPDVIISKAAEDLQGGFAIYRAVSETHGQMLIYVREYGAERFNREFEYGNRQGVEASVSFIVNPLDPHAHLSISKDLDGVSNRFDRQGYGVNESHDIEDRSPIRDHGSISLDISSGMGDSSRMPVKIGRLIAAGNQLRAQKVGSQESLHHNTNYFDQEKYGSIEGFAELARYTKRNLEAMIVAQRSQKLGSVASRRQSTPEADLKAA